MTGHVGVTGTRHGASPEQLTKARLILAANWQPGATLHHGKCRGADAQVHHLARSLGYAIEMHPPQNRAMEDMECALLPGEIMHARLPYLDRNQAIVDAVGRLIVIPELPETDAPRSGTWACYRQALRAGIPTDVLAPDDWIATR